MPPSRYSSHTAVTIIENAWIRFRDRQLFRILTHSVRTLENFMSHDILRRTSPKDYELLQDNSVPFTLRFRFSGAEFPPVIVFKIFTDSSVVPARYVSPAMMNGKQQVTDKRKFYSDLVKVRGSHSVTAQLLKDEVLHSQYGILSPEECVTSKDCLKLKSIQDELPAYMGGKGNTWRKLTLSDVPRLTILHDVLSFVSGPKVDAKIRRRMLNPGHGSIPDSRRIRAILPYLVANNDLDLHFKILTTVCRESDKLPEPSNAALALMKREGTTSTAVSLERRRAAKSRAKKLLNLYTGNNSSVNNGPGKKVPMVQTGLETDKGIENGLNVQGPEESFARFSDEEAEELFEWSKNLPHEDEIQF